MKAMNLCLAGLLMALPGLAPASFKAVVCDGCQELQYSDMAMRTAGPHETVVVFDGANAQLRKYRVSSRFDDDGRGVSRTARRLDPDFQEWAVFESAVTAYHRFSSGLEDCGPGGFGDWLVPDLNFAPACEQHDVCYAAGGDGDDRQDCDDQLYLTMLYMGAPTQLATGYYLAVRAAGWMFFSFRERTPTAGFDPLEGCNFLMVCDPDFFGDPSG